ncbi:MAG: hypothetical protein WA208_02135 [Thermoanaerobaculia bacterium]
MARPKITVPCVLFVFATAACTQTSGVVTGTSRPAVSPSSVIVYLEPPAEYEVIGLVTGHSVTGWTQQQDLNKAFAKLKQQAAKMGANGVLVEGVAGPAQSNAAIVVGAQGTASVIPTSPSSEARVTGKAIWVKRDR